MKKLQVNLGKLDSITRKSLIFFFNSDLCSFAELNHSSIDAEVIIFDYATGYDDSFLEKLAKNNQIGIVLHQSSGISNNNNRIIWQEKPLQVSFLKANLDKAFKLVNKVKTDILDTKKTKTNSVSEPTQKSPNIATNKHLSLAISKENTNDIQNRYRAHKHVGSNKDIDPNSSICIDHIYLTPDKYLFHYLSESIKSAQTNKSDIRIKTFLGNIDYDYKSKIFYYGFKNNKLKYMQSNPLFDDTKLSFIIIRDQTKTNDFKHTNPKGLIWESAILASKGRLPRGTKLQNIVKMVDWPNFSKLTVFRHSIQISATWSRNSLSIIDSAKQLRIPQRYVFTLYCAMQAINCASIDNYSTSNKIETTKSRNLFTKILSHIFNK